MIDVKYNEVKDRNSWIDGNYLNATICVTEDCNLRCTYCYMVGKNNVTKTSHTPNGTCSLKIQYFS